MLMGVYVFLEKAFVMTIMMGRSLVIILLVTFAEVVVRLCRIDRGV